jgi:hypothetical protein
MKMKPVKAWATVRKSDGFATVQLFENKADARYARGLYPTPKLWRIARVQITELTPKPRKK